MPLNVDKIYVYEWNPRQKVGHCETLYDFLKDSFDKMMQGIPQEWILIEVFPDQKSQGFFADRFYDLMHRR